MSTLKSAFRNLENEAAKLAGREITLADGSTTSFNAAMKALAYTFGYSKDYVDEPYESAPYAALGVHHAELVFDSAVRHHLEEFKQTDAEGFEIALHTLGRLNKDLTYLKVEDLSEETLQASREAAEGEYGEHRQGPEDDKIREGWLYILKSPENLQSAIQGVLTELNRSRLIPYAQDAYNKAYIGTTRQP